MNNILATFILVSLTLSANAALQKEYTLNGVPISPEGFLLEKGDVVNVKASASSAKGKAKINISSGLENTGWVVSPASLNSKVKVEDGYSELKIFTLMARNENEVGTLPGIDIDDYEMIYFKVKKIEGEKDSTPAKISSIVYLKNGKSFDAVNEEVKVGDIITVKAEAKNFDGKPGKLKIDSDKIEIPRTISPLSVDFVVSQLNGQSGSKMINVYAFDEDEIGSKPGYKYDQWEYIFLKVKKETFNGDGNAAKFKTIEVAITRKDKKDHSRINDSVTHKSVNDGKASGKKEEAKQE